MRRKLLTKEERAAVLQILLSTYPQARAELTYETPYQLLIATILSAQCTDIRVNQVTAQLFKILPAPDKIASLSQQQLEEIIKPCGLYKAKAGYIRATSQILNRQYGGELPADIALLQTLPGVGIKTANVVASNAFGIPAIAVDTHVQRVSNRLGLVWSDNVTKTERDLKKRLPRHLWTKLHHVLIFHGRYQCKARRPQCSGCTVKTYCMYFRKNVKKDDE